MRTMPSVLDNGRWATSRRVGQNISIILSANELSPWMWWRNTCQSARNMSVTRDWLMPVSLVYLHIDGRSTLITSMCRHTSYLHIHHHCSTKAVKSRSLNRPWNFKWLYWSVTASSRKPYLWCFCAPLGPHLAVWRTPRVCGCLFVVCSSSSSKVKCHSRVWQILPRQHQELHEDAES